MRRRLRMLFIICLLLTAAVAGLIWHASEEIIHPPRRVLQDYHQEILGNPAKFGLKITSIDVPATNDSEFPTPVIVCEPLNSPGERGKRLRDQLSKRLSSTSIPTSGEIKGTIVLLHGRKGRKEDGLPIAERFCAAGFRCILLDLPGHGENTNPIASYGLREWDLPDRVEKYTRVYLQYAATPRFLWGISQGGSVAVHAAAKTGDWKALIVVSSFSEFEGVCLLQSKQYFGPLSTPVFSILQKTIMWRAGYALSQISPVKLASHLKLPTFIAHGDADELISIEDGKKLYNAISSADKKWCLVQGGTHDRVLTTSMPLYAEMAQFFLERLNTK